MNLLNRALISGLTLASLVALPSLAFAQYVPNTLNISGGLYQPSGQPVTSSSVSFRIEIWDKNATCKLYEETHLAQDLSQTKGGFSLALGQGSSITNFRDGGNPGSLSWLVFANPGAPATVFAGCGGGVIFAAGDNRLIRVFYDIGGGMTAMTPDVPIESAAYAMVANTLEGKAASEFIQVRDDVGTDLSQSNIENVFSATNYAKLVEILTNTFSAGYSFNNQRITNVGTPTAGTDAVNRTWVDGHVGDKAADLSGVGSGVNNGYTLVWDAAGNRWTTGVPSAIDNSKLPLAGGTMSGPITMGGFDLYNTGHITMGNQRMLTLGRYTSVQEGGLGLGAGDEGRMFYNTDLDVVRVWDGTQYIGFGASGAAGGDLTGSYPNPTIAVGAVTTTKIGTDAVQSTHIDNAGIGINRLVISDNVSGNALRFKTCALNQILRWEATGWQCVDVATALPNSGATAGVYGSSTMVSRIGVNAQGVVTSAVDVAINFPVVSVNGKTGVVVLNGADLGLGTASLEDVGNGANEIPMTDGAGKLNPSVIPTLGIGDISGAITQIVAGSGLTGGGTQGVVTLAVDLTQVDAYKIRGRDVAATAPASSDVLMWNAGTSVWEPQTIPSAPVYTFTGNNGALVSGPALNKTISIDTGVTTGQIVQVAAGNRLPVIDGSNLTQISNLRNVNVSTTAPTLNQVLQYNGSAWEAATLTDNAGVTLVTAGTGLLGGVINSTGTISVDVGTGANQIVQLDGSSRLPAVNGSLLTNVNAVKLQTYDVHTAAPADNQVLTWNNSASRWEARSPGAGADNLGSHIAAQNIQLNGFWLSGDGGNEGVFVAGTGNVGVGTGTPNANSILDINGLGAMSALLVPRDTQGNRPTGVNGMIRYNTNTAKMEVFESGGWSDVVQSADGVGVSYVATTSDLTGGPISTTGTLGVNTGTGANQILKLNGSSQIPAVDGSLLTNVNAYSIRGVNVSTTAPTLNQVLQYNGSGWEAATLPAANDVAAGTAILLSGPATMRTISVDVGIGANQIPQLNGSGYLGIGTASVTTGAVADFYGASNLDSAVVLPRATTANRPGGVNGMIRYNTSLAKFEVYENGNWFSMATGSTGDNLGNHIATQAVQLNGQWLSNDGGAEGIHIANNGNVGVGTSTPTSLLEVFGTGNLEVTVTTAGGAGQAAQLKMDRQGAGASYFGPSASNVFDIFTGENIPMIFSTNSQQRMIVENNGQVGIGTVDAQTGAILEIYGTGVNYSSVIVPRDSTANRPIGVNGMIRYNTNTARFEAYEGGGWVNMTAVGAGTGDFKADGTVPMTGTFRLNGQWLSNDGGAEGIFIDTAGKVGINTNSIEASADLQVDGEIYIKGNSALQIEDGGIRSYYRKDGFYASQGSRFEYTYQAQNDIAVGINTTVPTSGSALDVRGTGAFFSSIIIPRDSSANRPTGVNGMIRYNTNLAKFEVYEAGNWTNMVSSGGTAAGSNNYIQYNSGGSFAASSSFQWNNAGSLLYVGGDISVENSTGAVLTLSRDDTTTVNGDTLGTININSTDLGVENPAIQIKASENHSGSTGGNSLSLFTVPNGTTASVERLTILQNGAVGVGTTSPLKVVDIAPPSNATATLGLRSTGGAGAKIYFGTSSQYDGTGSNHAGIISYNTVTTGGFEFRTNNQAGDPENNPAMTRLSISAPGRIGIGTTAAATGSIMDVIGTGTNFSSIIIPRDSTANRPTGVNGMIRYNTNLAKFEVYEAGNWTNMVASGVSSQWTDGAGGDIYYNGGDVGIGTNNPSQALHLLRSEGNTYASSSGSAVTPILTGSAAAIIQNSFNGNNMASYLGFRVQNGAPDTQNAYIGVVSNGSTYNPTMVFGAQSGANAYQERMRISDTGNVGIGTNNPTYKLDLLGAGSSGMMRSVTTGATQNYSLLMSDTGGSVLQTQTAGGFNQINMQYAGAGWASAADNNQMGALVFAGWNGSAGKNAASVESEVDGAPAGGNIPGRLQFRTADVASGVLTDRMVIKSDGKVGIGTLTPSTGSLLDLTGTGVNFSSLLIPRDSTANRPTGVNGMIRYNTNLAKFEVYEAGNWANMVSSGGSSQWTTAGSDIYYSTGEVGIGTNNPTAPLEIASNGDNPQLILNDTVGGLADDVYIRNDGVRLFLGNQTDGQTSLVIDHENDRMYFGNYIGSPNAVRLEVTANSTGDDLLALSSTAIVTGDRFIVKNNGNVGIGTTTPNVGAILDVNGTGNLSSLLIPRGTTAERAVAAANGMIRYNTNTARFEVYETSWKNMVASSTGATNIDELTDGVYNATAESLYIGAGTGGGSTNARTENTAVGHNALGSINNDSADFNTALGRNALGGLTSGNQNVAVGTSAGSSSTTSNGSTYIGNAAGWSSTGSGNTLVGNQASAGTTGEQTVAIGNFAGSANTTGWQNVIIGYNAAGEWATAADLSDSVIIGYEAGKNISGGDSNILMGWRAGDTLTTGNNNIVIGHDIDTQAPTSNNTLTIGNMIFGTGINGTGTTVSGGRIGIGTAAPSLGAVLDVHGTGNLTSMILPRGTTVERAAAGVNGMIRYNTNLSKFEVYQANSWTQMMTGSGAAGDFMANGSVPMTGTFRLNDQWLSNDGGAEGIRVDNSGNVGIGTVNPTVPLQLGSGSDAFVSPAPLLYLSQANNPGIVLRDNGTNVEAYMYAWTTGHVYMGSGTNHDLRFDTNGATRMTIKANGIVGIGTASPQHPLHIDSSGDTNLAITSSAANANTNIRFGSRIGGSTRTAVLQVGWSGEFNFIPGSDLVDAIKFNNAADSKTHMQIDTISGRVGIGTTSMTAGAILDLNGTGNLSSLLLPRGTTAERAVAAANGMIRYNTNTSKFEGFQAGTWTDLGGGGGGSSQWTDGAGGDIYYNGGHVGIGTTNPANVLDVRRDQDAGTALVLRNASTGTNAYTQLEIHTDANAGTVGMRGSGYVGTWGAMDANDFVFTSNEDFAFLGSSATSNIKFGTGATPNERMRISANGSVGIGTDTPAVGAILDLFGTGNMSNLLLPRGTTAQRAATAINGMIRYNTNLSAFEVYANNQWATVATGSGGSQWSDASGGEIYYNGGLVGIGTNDPDAQLHVFTTGATQNRIYQGSSTGGSQHVLESIGGYTGIQFEKAGAGWTSTGAGTQLGDILTMGVDSGLNYRYSSSISMEVDAAPDASSVPGRLVFSTSALGSGTPSERMRITSQGRVGIGTTTIDAKLHVNGQILGGYASGSSATIDWSAGNIQRTSVAAPTTLDFTNGTMFDGGSYTLVLTGTTGTYTLGVAGDITTWKCSPACASNQIATTGETVLTIIKIGTTGYVSWITGF